MYGGPNLEDKPSAKLPVRDSVSPGLWVCAFKGFWFSPGFRVLARDVGL